MRYIATADTDIGIVKPNNQDSLLIKHANSDLGEILLTVVCDGMGGLAKGELASATVIRAFADWFDRQLPYELENLDLQVIGGKWVHMLKSLNVQIMEYGQRLGANLGTTVSGMLFVGDRFLAIHVGDTRIYQIGTALNQLTTDQTFIAREIARGTMTPEQAKTDKRRNLLLQCVGASQTVDPQVFCGVAERGTYMICTDGFRHEITPQEIYTALHPNNLVDENAMHNNARYLIELNKSRQERDNISVLLIKAE